MRRLWRGRRHAGRAVTLTGGEVGTVLAALAEAAAWRRYRAAQWCDACEAHPLRACGEHVEDLIAAEAYDGLAVALSVAAGLRR